MVVLFIIFQILILKKRPANYKKLSVGIIMTIVGFFFFLLGAQISLIPMGERIGAFLAHKNPFLVIFLVFLIGIIVIFAEPAINLLAYEIEKVSAGFLKRRYILSIIALGVGLALALIVIRIYLQLPILYILFPGYLLILILTWLAPPRIIQIAFDSGAVATGPVVVTFALPIITSIAMGILGEQAGVFGLGTIGVVAMCPIICLLIFDILINRRMKNE